MVASGLDFFVGITAAGEALVAGVALGLLLVAAGEAALVAAGELTDLGAGEEAFFSVVTETLGSSVFSEAVASGDAAGLGLEVSS
jgi:hypothetical protein